MMMGPAAANHDDLWSDRLLDWVDGAVDPVFESHRSECASCREQLRELKKLHASLQAALPSMALDNAFDRRIFACIDAMDESQLVAARQRAEREFRENMQSLSRGWRRALGFVIPSVIAGVALVFAVTGWFDDAGVTRIVAESTQGFLRIDGVRDAFGGDIAGTVRFVFTALLGAGIGLVVARWLAAAAD